MGEIGLGILDPLDEPSGFNLVDNPGELRAHLGCLLVPLDRMTPITAQDLEHAESLGQGGGQVDPFHLGPLALAYLDRGGELGPVQVAFPARRLDHLTPQEREIPEDVGTATVLPAEAMGGIRDPTLTPPFEIEGRPLPLMADRTAEPAYRVFPQDGLAIWVGPKGWRGVLESRPVDPEMTGLAPVHPEDEDVKFILIQPVQHHLFHFQRTRPDGLQALFQAEGLRGESLDLVPHLLHGPVELLHPFLGRLELLLRVLRLRLQLSLPLFHPIHLGEFGGIIPPLVLRLVTPVVSLVQLAPGKSQLLIDVVIRRLPSLDLRDGGLIVRSPSGLLGPPELLA